MLYVEGNIGWSRKNCESRMTELMFVLLKKLLNLEKFVNRNVTRKSEYCIKGTLYNVFLLASETVDREEQI